ncbi:hypothetical protein [Vibrio neptunius]|uniref:Lipoprotein n=1 Tax=Vibrio neptunius TaxID=170651 RepID=A0ABS3AAJ4_9VIBR|nr:hypothetical protein [Vibrio neptunius]MBN3495287.1 hypothetical protein [Vibrio neptunius]MBN3517789.1 hypothetical protein [Vibrio neptunius]MBN3552061.1 hypothetical protein [Vibrio neptunius]MBN3580102.1 hypothetical protein [Vibrio neptunius]MCH9873768.1 hypothetical protein [Vibrio neptunius]
MNKLLSTLLLGLLILNTAGCQDEEEQAPLRTVAKIGNAGSISGDYGINDLYIQTVGGSWVSFSFGATNGYPGASADIGGMGVPAHINGTWRKGRFKQDFEYYRIDAPIDAALAEQKIRTLNHYYKSFKRRYGVMQVVVNHEQVQILYTLKCFSVVDDCTAKDNSDPNGWVTMSPTNTTQVVVLFDGKGETSPTPFEPSNPYE